MKFEKNVSTEFCDLSGVLWVSCHADKILSKPYCNAIVVMNNEGCE
jgi:hypothetical protein